MQAEDKAKEKIDFLLFSDILNLNCIDDVVDVRCRKNKNTCLNKCFLMLGYSDSNQE